MFKTMMLVSLTMTTACAKNDKPIVTKDNPVATTDKAVPASDQPGGEMSANRKSETAGNVAFVTSKDGTKIAFERVGKGPALVIVGGALSQRNGGKALAAKLMDRFSVYTFDRRGRGDSGDTKPYAVDREIEDIGALIEHAGNNAYLYGVSSGAALSLQAAEKLGPAKVSKLAIYDAPYGQDTGEFQKQKERIDQLVQTGKPGDAAAFFFSSIGMPPPAIEDMKRSPQWKGMSQIDFTLVYDYEVLGNGSVPDSVKGITVPTLVMVGEKSMPFMHPTADRIAELVPNAQRKTVKGQQHQAAPEIVAPLLSQFFGEGA